MLGSVINPDEDEEGRGAETLREGQIWITVPKLEIRKMCISKGNRFRAQWQSTTQLEEFCRSMIGSHRKRIEAESLSLKQPYPPLSWSWNPLTEITPVGRNSQSAHPRRSRFRLLTGGVPEDVPGFACPFQNSRTPL